MNKNLQHIPDDEFKKNILDSKSKSFCGAKWYNATVWLGSGMTTSCHHPPAHHVSIDEVKKNPKALHNTIEKKKDREQMQRGERPPGCEYCWKIEDMEKGSISDRVYKTKIYSQEEIDDAFNLEPHKDVDLKTLEISFDRTCNFACSYCNPAFSTTWVKDIKKNGGYENLISDGRNHFTHDHKSSQLFAIKDINPYAEAFLHWWETDLHKTLRELRITGGEPLMSGYTWKLLEWFKENKGKSNTKIAINSNLGVSKKELTRLLDSVSIPIDIYTSNESMYSHAEYIRDGLDWDTWVENVYYVANSEKCSQLHMMCTINALCLESLTDFLDWILEFKKEFGKFGLVFTLNILRFPSFQSPLVLPDHIRDSKCQDLKKWRENNINSELLHDMEYNQIDRLIDYLDIVKTPHSDSFELPKLRNDFKRFYEQYDQRRNKDFVSTFPSLADWYISL